MTRRGRPREITRGNSNSSRVRLTPVRKAQLDARLVAQALIAAQLLINDNTNPTGDPARQRKEVDS